MNCPRCGAFVRSRFCTNCGTEIVPPTDLRADDFGRVSIDRSPVAPGPSDIDGSSFFMPASFDGSGKTTGSAPGSTFSTDFYGAETPDSGQQLRVHMGGKSSGLSHTPMGGAARSSDSPNSYGSSHTGERSYDRFSDDFHTGERSYDRFSDDFRTEERSCDRSNDFGSSGGPTRLAGGDGVGILRRLASSPLYLISAISLSVSVLLGIITLLSDELRWIGRLFAGLDIMLYITTIFNSLVLVGLWVTFASSVKKGTTRVATGGITLIKVVVIIRFVLFCLAIGLAIILSMIALVTAARIGGSLAADIGIVGEMTALSELFGGIAILMLLFMIAVLVLGIFFYIGLIKTTNTIRYTSNTGKPSNRVSSYSAVICMLLAVLLLYLVIVSFQAELILPAFHYLLLAVALICFAVQLFQYKSAMSRAGGYGY